MARDAKIAKPVVRVPGASVAQNRRGLLTLVARDTRRGVRSALRAHPCRDEHGHDRERGE